jgi:hypothetical protein
MFNNILAIPPASTRSYCGTLALCNQRTETYRPKLLPGKAEEAWQKYSRAYLGLRSQSR